MLEGLLEGGSGDDGEEQPGEDLTSVLDGLEAPEPEDDSETAEDVLAGLADSLTEPEEADNGGLESILGGLDAPAGEAESDLSAALDTLDAPQAEDAEDSGLDDLLADLGSDAPEEIAEDGTGDVLEGLAAETESAEAAGGGDPDLDALLGGDDDAGADGLDDLLGDLTNDDGADALDELLSDPGEAPAAEAAADDGGLDDLLGDLDSSETAGGEDPGLDTLLAGADAPGAEDSAGDDLDTLLGGLDEPETEEISGGGLDDLLGGAGAEDALLDDLLGDLGSEEEDGDLDDLLAGLGEEAAAEDAAADDGAEDDLDALLGGLGDADAGLDGLMGDSSDMELDDLLGGLGGDEEDANDADALPGGPDEGGVAQAAAGAQASDEPEFAYGTMSADRPEPQKLERKRFRLAVLGDFSGRAAKGLLETGDGLASRKAILLDPDTVEDVIESFATELVLPIGKDGAGIAVKLEDLDGLHPDELYENVELFSELVGLRKQLQSGATADHAAGTLKAWAEKHGTKARAPKRTSAGNAVPADKRLSAFQLLIGATGITPAPGLAGGGSAGAGGRAAYPCAAGSGCHGDAEGRG